MTRDEADNQLRKAIIDHAEAYDIDQEGELLSEYAVIASWQKVEDNGRHYYTTQFHTPTVPNHVAVGLFQVGQRLVWDSDDEGDDC